MQSNLTVTLIQTDLQWENKEANRAMLEGKIRALVTSGTRTEVVILPEMFSTGFSMRPEALAESMNGPMVTWMKDLSAELRIILTGSLIIEEEGNYYNRLLWVLPNGQTGQYDKKHLFAAGTEHEHYQPGDRRLIASVKGWRVNLQICYDLRFPTWSRQQVTDGAPEYDLLVYVANWPDKRINAWKTLLQARAIENQCFTIGVNRVGEDANGNQHTGDSMIIDPSGAILYNKSNVEDVFTFTLEREVLEQVRERLPFLKDADSFMLMRDGD